jgi:hypothetical protein
MHIKEIIEKSGIKSDYVRQRLGYSRPGWYKKRKLGNFSPEELEKIFKIIHIEDLEDRVLSDMMKSAKRSRVLTEKETKMFFASLLK